MGSLATFHSMKTKRQRRVIPPKKEPITMGAVKSTLGGARKLSAICQDPIHESKIDIGDIETELDI
jgi:hypothetical protein